MQKLCFPFLTFTIFVCHFHCPGGVHCRCRNIDFGAAFRCFLLVRRCWIPSEWVQRRKPGSFFSFFPHSDITCPKHISAVHVNNVRQKWSLTGQEEIKFDHILGRLCSELCRYIPVPKFLIVTVWTDTGGWSKLQLVIAVTCQNSN